MVQSYSNYIYFVYMVITQECCYRKVYIPIKQSLDNIQFKIHFNIR